jgi:hypothetical protein
MLSDPWLPIGSRCGDVCFVVCLCMCACERVSVMCLAVFVRVCLCVAESSTNRWCYVLVCVVISCFLVVDLNLDLDRFMSASMNDLRLTMCLHPFTLVHLLTVGLQSFAARVCRMHGQVSAWQFAHTQDTDMASFASTSHPNGICFERLPIPLARKLLRDLGNAGFRPSLRGACCLERFGFRGVEGKGGSHRHNGFNLMCVHLCVIGTCRQ